MNRDKQILVDVLMSGLDVAGPLLLVGSQVLWFLQPLLAGWAPAEQVAKWATMLAEPEAPEQVRAWLAQQGRV